MNNFKHLTQNQIFAYADDSLSEPESNEIGRHLIQCAVCRKSLPAPSVEQFWAAIMNERETEDNPTAEESEYSRMSVFSFFPAFFSQPGSLLLSGGALIALLSFSALIWFSVGNSEREISQSFATDTVEAAIKQNIPLPAPSLQSDSQSSILDARPKTAVSTTKSVKTVPPKQNSGGVPQKISSQPSERKLPADKNVSATRGVLPKCEDGQSFESQAVVNGEKVVLNWEKVPNAAKYHLYISDEDEILIDEFETTEATSYVLKKLLDAGKVYKWKIIVTLENGKTVVGESQRFTVKDLQSKQKKTGNRRSSAIRCSMNSLVEN